MHFEKMVEKSLQSKDDLSFYSRTNNNTLLGYDSTEINLKRGALIESKNGR